MSDRYDSSHASTYVLDRYLRAARERAGKSTSTDRLAFALADAREEISKLESALLDCQRYVLENGIDMARAQVYRRVSEALAPASRESAGAGS